ncbi:IS3 family transposase [Roseomonas pecuniae]|uniref:IS3 family transposase n=1 Tax=Roseomonas populi TaxID=3121582 RepID=A0ABT1XCZ5_9PROT|nr:IS3 family transposase [Roseomonas pecuniae]MCR0984992.1 IS3 family transposase [Roseomonas pecuniae]
MKKKRFSVEQIVSVLKQAELGLPVADLVRQVGISEQTFYRWKKQYAGLQSEQVREFKQVTEENARLKRLVAELSLDKAVLQDVLFKKIPRPAVMKEVVAYVTASHGFSERRACALTRQHRSTQRKPSTRDPRLEIRQRMHEIARTRIRYGYRRLQVMLRRDGWAVGKNLVWRLYREEGLALRSKRPRRRKMVVQREARCAPKRPNEAWSLDFIQDQLSSGGRFRALTVVDVFSREGLAIEVGQRLRGEHVVEVLNRLVGERGAPKYLFADNGAEFTGRLVDLWAYHHGTRIDFSRPGKPTDNAFIETFNGSLRDECLNLHWFETLAEARREIEAWRRDYNESRPHMALGQRTPQEYRSLASLSGLSEGSVAGEG